MNKEAWSGVARHALTIAGGLLVGLGYIDEGVAQEATGAIMSLVGVVLSILSKRK